MQMIIEQYKKSRTQRMNKVCDEDEKNENEKSYRTQMFVYCSNLWGRNNFFMGLSLLCSPQLHLFGQKLM